MVIIGTVAIVLAVVFWGVWLLVLKWRELAERRRLRSLPPRRDVPAERKPVAAPTLRQDDRRDEQRDRPAA